MFVMVLDIIRYELFVRFIYLEGDGQQFLDVLQCELVIIQYFLVVFDVGDLEENVQVLDLLSEFKDVMEKKDFEF